MLLHTRFPLPSFVFRATPESPPLQSKQTPNAPIGKRAFGKRDSRPRERIYTGTLVNVRRLFFPSTEDRECETCQLSARMAGVKRALSTAGSVRRAGLRFCFQEATPVSLPASCRQALGHRSFTAGMHRKQLGCPLAKVIPGHKTDTGMNPQPGNNALVIHKIEL